MLMFGACAPHVAHPGPDVAPPMLQAERFIAADGAALPLRAWRPEGKPRAVILALHGFNDYANAFDAAGAHFARHGVLTYAYDQRGFGAAPNPGLWPGGDALIADFRAILAAISAAHPGVPLFALGDSMGGAVVLSALAEAAQAGGAMHKNAGPGVPALAGAILVAPAVWGRATMPAYQRWALWTAAHSVPWLALTAEGLSITPSDNREMLAALSRDPLVIKRTRVDAIFGLVDLMDRALAAAPALPGPALILYGAADEVVPKPPLRRFVARLPDGDGHRLAYYPDGYHMLLRDLGADQVLDDILAWIGAPAALLPSGADRDARARLVDASH